MRFMRLSWKINWKDRAANQFQASHSTKAKYSERGSTQSQLDSARFASIFCLCHCFLLSGVGLLYFYQAFYVSSFVSIAPMCVFVIVSKNTFIMLFALKTRVEQSWARCMYSTGKLNQITIDGWVNEKSSGVCFFSHLILSLSISIHYIKWNPVTERNRREKSIIHTRLGC